MLGDLFYLFKGSYSFLKEKISNTNPAKKNLNLVSLCLSISLSVYLPACLSVCLSVCLSIYLSISTYLCKKSINGRVVCSAPVRNQSRVTKLVRTQREILNIQSVLVTRKLRRWIDQDIVARIELTLVQFISRLFSRIREFCNATISYKPLYRILLPKPLRTHFPNL